MPNVRKAFLAVLERMSRKLVNKLVLLFTSIIILVVVSLTFISYQILQKESLRNSISSTSNNLLLVNQNMEDYLKGMEKLSLPQIRYDEITYAIMHESEDYASKMYLEDYLRELYYSRNDLKAIYMYVVKQHKYYAITKENYNITVRIGSAPGITGLPWYKKAMASPSNRSYQSFVEPGSDPGYPIDTGTSFMAYHRVLRSIVARQPQAVLSFYFDSSGRDEIMKDIPFDTGQHLLFLSPDNEPFYADDLTFYERAKASGLISELKESDPDPLTWSEKEQKYLVVFNVGATGGLEAGQAYPLYAAI